jgi:hypothetical protein
LIGPAFAQAATPPSLKIGIIGSGNMGSTLGTLWVKSGHPVLFSSRHPEELKKLVDGLGPLARAGTVREASIRRSARIMRRISKARLLLMPATRFPRAMVRSPRKRVKMESAPRQPSTWRARVSSALSTHSTISGLPALRIARKAALAFPWQVMTKTPWR